MKPLRARLHERRRVSACTPRALATCVAFALAGCSSGDTILALNVSSADDVGRIEELRVSVTQLGEEPVEVRFAPPLKELDDDAGQAIESSFFRRIKLPSGWDEAPAVVMVMALGPAGVAPLSARATVEVEPGEAAAAFVELARTPPETSRDDAGAGDAGASDAGAEAVAGDAAADAGDAGAAGSGGG